MSFSVRVPEGIDGKAYDHRYEHDQQTVEHLEKFRNSCSPSESF